MASEALPVRGLLHEATTVGTMALGGIVKKILVVDDSEMIRATAVDTLQSAGFTVFQACDGLDGMAKLSEHAVDLIILDTDMPRLTGIEMLEKVRQDRKWDRVPVVMLTTPSHCALIERAQQLGAAAWLIKPMKPQNLVLVAKKLVG